MLATGNKFGGRFVSVSQLHTLEYGSKLLGSTGRVSYLHCLCLFLSFPYASSYSSWSSRGLSGIHSTITSPSRNGAPFREGDVVRILRGPHKQKVVPIYDVWIERDQVRVNLGEKEKNEMSDVFSLLSIRKLKKG